jgi:hypothetical protein
MSPRGTYSFLPWLRQGIANTITSPDNDPSVKTRASVRVELQLTGDPLASGVPDLTAPLPQDIALYGPGDIVGIDARSVFRTDPRPWITNYESNFLAAAEFYDEDFLWRYTPAAPDGSGLKLRPWLTLIVLQETEFSEDRGVGRASPCIAITNRAALPAADELWAWAHVHFNQSLAASDGEHVSPDMGAVLPKVQAIIGQNPDLAYSRLVCPRRLDDNTGYHAFVVPTFETGRLAGIGKNPTLAPNATYSAWGPAYGGQPEPSVMPVYFRWYFRTGSKGDFEYLVTLLKPQPINAGVGTRDMDVQDPGSNIPGITDPALGGVLRLGGALQVPEHDLNIVEREARQKYENWDQPYPQPFQTALAAFVNLPDDYAAQTAAAANAATAIPGIADDPDPLITAPLYGRWHALTQRLLTKQDGTPADNNQNWVHKLNLDPHYRVPASFATDVIATNAETYMNYAWQQIGDVLAANRKIRHLQLATEVATLWHQRSLTPLANVNAERAFAMTAPVAGRLRMGKTTVAFTQAQSLVPPVLTSAAMRRVVRPGARMMRQLPFDAKATRSNMLARINAGEVSAAPPKAVPPALPTVDQAAGAAHPAGAPGWILDLLAKYPWLPWAVLIALLVIAIVLLFVLPMPAGAIAAVVAAAVGIGAFAQLRNWQNADAPAQGMSESNQTPASVDALPSNPGFVIVDPTSTVTSAPGATDSATAARFKTALRDSFTLAEAARIAGQRPAPVALDLAAATQTLVAGVDPRITIPRRGLATIGIPAWIRDQIGADFNEVMAYPKIDLPMYEPLKQISTELFLPNINLIAQNSITLIETNQNFIEAYMVGLNHEFARELLWRGYPTDQRGSYFRQFWDVRGFIDSEGQSGDPLKEKLYDIPELHRWAKDSKLGEHNNRIPPGQPPKPQAVLVIRGELLKKYPTAVIYAQHALWPRNQDGTVDFTRPRMLDQPSTPAEEQSPPLGKIRSPLYEAKADPDIYFFGFDLTIEQAKGGTGENPNDDAGWFFVIKERPGEPRFGFELDRPTANPAANPTVFDQLTWDDALPGGAPGQFLSAGSLASVVLDTPPAGDPDVDQHNDDQLVNGAAVSSARWAYLMFRAPILVAVHSAEMLA